MAKALLIAAIVLAGLVVVHFLLNWLTRDRPKDYRNRGSTGMGNALLEIHSMIQSGARHQLEEMRKDLTEDDDSGDPPRPESPEP